MTTTLANCTERFLMKGKAKLENQSLYIPGQALKAVRVRGSKNF